MRYNRINWILKSVYALIVFLLMVIVSSVGIYHVSYDAEIRVQPDTESLTEEISTEAFKSDLKYLITTLEEVHPDLYASISQGIIEQHRKRIEQSLTDSLTRIEFFKLISPLVARFEDGHTGVSIPSKEFIAFRDSGGVAFPFTVYYEADAGLMVQVSYTDNISSGDRILEINGTQADSLLSVFSSLMSGKRKAFRDNRAARNFRLLLWLHKIDAPYTIRFEKNNPKEIQTILVEGHTRNEIIRLDSLRGNSPTEREPYVYKRLDDNIAYIDFRSMNDRERFAAFLENTFEDISENPPGGLIVDLRNNGGGDSRLGNQLLEYITDEPYVMSSAKAWKMSKKYKNHLRKNLSPVIRWITYPPAIWIVKIFRPEAKTLTAKNGEIVTFESGPVRPGEKPLRYEGKVCFLIGRQTFSSAMMLANAVEDNDIAMLIGEETGGIPNHFGEIYSFLLPNSKLTAYVSSAKYIRASGDAQNMNGVLPDMEISDSAAYTDTVLTVARNWILSDKSF